MSRMIAFNPDIIVYHNRRYTQQELSDMLTARVIPEHRSALLTNPITLKYMAILLEDCGYDPYAGRFTITHQLSVVLQIPVPEQSAQQKAQEEAAKQAEAMRVRQAQAAERQRQAQLAEQKRQAELRRQAQQKAEDRRQAQLAAQRQQQELQRQAAIAAQREAERLAEAARLAQLEKEGAQQAEQRVLPHRIAPHGPRLFPHQPVHQLPEHIAFDQKGMRNEAELLQLFDQMNI